MLITVSLQHLDAKPANVFQFNEPYSLEVRDMNVIEFAEHVSHGGFFKAAVFDIDKCRQIKIDKKVGDSANKAIMGKENANGCNVICLDFDEVETPPSKIVEELAGKGMLPNFMYYSFSQNPESIEKSKQNCIPKPWYLYNNNKDTKVPRYKNGYNFRLVWCLSRTLSNDEYESIYKQLLDFTKELGVNADKATKDVSRLWWGGKLGYELYSTEPVNIKASLGWQEITKRIDKSPTNKISRIINAKNEYIGEYKIDVKFPNAAEVKDKWWEQLRGGCPLWNRYENGEYLEHNERLTLFTNLKFLKRNDTSSSIYKDVMQFYKPEVWEGHTFDEKQLKMWLTNKTLGAYPICRTVDGYKTVADYFHQPDCDIPRIVDKSNRPTIAEVDKVIGGMIDEALLSDTSNYFKSQTASGKTEHIIDFLINRPAEEKYIVALPYLNSIKEFEQRWYAKTKRALNAMPTDCEYTDMDLARLGMGLGKESKDMRRKSFIEQLKLDEELSGGVFVITHALLTNLSYIPCKRIIIDENIEEALVEEYEFSKSQLRTIADFVEPKSRDILNRFLDSLDCIEHGDVDIRPIHDILPDFENHIIDYLDTIPESMRPLGIFNTRKNDYGKKCGDGIRVRVKTPFIVDAINDNIPISIFTATPMPTLIKEDYGVDFDIVEAPLAQNTGKIYQYTGVSGARGKNNSKVIPMLNDIKQVMEKRSEKPLSAYYLITYKLSEELRKEAEKLGFVFPYDNEGKQIHIDNCAGLDFLKGKEIIMAAKKNLPEGYYIKKFEDFTGEIVEHLDMNWYEIEVNGYRQRCYLYTNDMLRQIQMENINKIAVQAIGRARALREESAIVHYFSDYLVDESDVIYVK